MLVDRYVSYLVWEGGFCLLACDCEPARSRELVGGQWAKVSGRLVHHVSPRWLEPRMENVDTAPEMNDLR